MAHPFLELGPSPQADDNLRRLTGARLRDAEFIYPPAHLTGGGLDKRTFEYQLGGVELMWMLLVHANMSSSHRVLDLGCGTGRLAAALTGYLDDGRYFGLDVARTTIDWAKGTYRSDVFSFNTMDVYHPMFNPSGNLKGDALVIPMADKSVDSAMMSSVITHIYQADALRYVDELHRVLVDGGVACVSFFSLGPDDYSDPGTVSRLIGVGDGVYSYRWISLDNQFFYHCEKDGRPKNHFGKSWDIGDPVAYDKAYLVDIVKARKSWSSVAFVDGRWRVGGERPPFQDFLILTK